MRLKKSWKKVWDFLWHDDSLLSWVSFIVVIFVLIKFIFFPTLSFITGTSLPIVIVESCSMHHDSGFDNWWSENGEWYETKGISKDYFKKLSLRNGFNKGDILFVRGIDKDEIKIGDVIIFTSGLAKHPIIHRVVNLDPLETKGDNNRLQFSLDNNPYEINEKNIEEEQIIGKASFFKIPFLGWVKLIFYEPFRPENERGFCK